MLILRITKASFVHVAAHTQTQTHNIYIAVILYFQNIVCDWMLFLCVKRRKPQQRLQDVKFSEAMTIKRLCYSLPSSSNFRCVRVKKIAILERLSTFFFGRKQLRWAYDVFQCVGGLVSIIAIVFALPALNKYIRSIPRFHWYNEISICKDVWPFLLSFSTVNPCRRILSIQNNSCFIQKCSFLFKYKSIFLL